jgi:hypothetical protein
MDGTTGFSASNKSNYLLTRGSNCRWGRFVGGLKKGRYWSRIYPLLENQGRDCQVDAAMRLATPNKLRCPLEGSFNHGDCISVSGLKKTRKSGKSETKYAIPQRPAIVMENGW